MSIMSTYQETRTLINKYLDKVDSSNWPANGMDFLKDVGQNHPDISQGFRGIKKILRPTIDQLDMVYKEELSARN